MPCLALVMQAALQAAAPLNFDSDKSLYPGITTRWRALAENGTAQTLLQQVPPHLRPLLVEEGRVQVCAPWSERKARSQQVHPYLTPLQLVALRTANFCGATPLALSDGMWAQVGVP